MTEATTVMNVYRSTRKRLKLFRAKYVASRAASLLPDTPPDYDVVFVIDRRFHGWILEAMCREIGQRLDGRFCIHHACTNLPKAKAYWFSHHALFPECLRLNPWIWNSRRVVFFTHPSEHWGLTDEELVYSLNHADRVVLMCHTFRSLLESLGVRQDKVAVLFGGADPELFTRHERGAGVVGLCSAFYPRKSPDLVLEVVRALPHRSFVLLGRNWHHYSRIDELRALSNFEYVEAPYEEYPAHYGRMDVFLSAATIEGGPIPLLEAMMSNVVPVASATGFAPDLIQHGANGFLFSPGAPADVVKTLIESAYRLPADVRRSVEHLTWDRFASQARTLLVQD